MSSYQENKERLKDKYHNQGGQEKATEYYENNKEIIKEKSRARYQNLSEEQKELKTQYSRDRYKKLIDLVNKVK